MMVVGLSLAACGDRGGDDRPPQPGDEAVARVDGKAVWASDVKREAVAQGLIGEGEPLDISSDLFRRVLDEVIDQKLLAAEALSRNLDEDPVAQRRLAAARERILGDMLVESVVSDAVNENAIRGLYQEQLKLARQSEEIRARQIVVATPEEGEAVKNLLTTGASFEALAMERSTDAATRFNGGDLGYFTTDVMPEAYEGALKAAKTGEIVGPFEVEGGWAVVRVEDRRLEEPITLEAARPQIIRFLTYDQVRDLLEKLRGRAKVETLIGAGEAVPGAPVEPADAAAEAPKAAEPAKTPAPAAKVPAPKSPEAK
ncbi:peptidylprolyl isomerase [Phenylobacterium sp.]|uniref:peptidylprolyl isomerase n=1 Tax=Phenylobacterium sp. TaxID=1871053 RepID=UPI002731C19D|nr:peptidylprolyl isomerase [Phenylobacterium sp.]MDP1617450.1 peptidylprolyl isomerase [Phenylobacterium sp.]MDP1988787.1 peptidylprolyl isomerase [Phenylobacterium sp.]